MVGHSSVKTWPLADHMGCAMEVYWISSWFYGAMVEDLCFCSTTMVALAALGLVAEAVSLCCTLFSPDLYVWIVKCLNVCVLILNKSESIKPNFVFEICTGQT